MEEGPLSIKMMRGDTTESPGGYGGYTAEDPHFPNNLYAESDDITTNSSTSVTRNSLVPVFFDANRLIVTSPHYYRHRHCGKDTKEIGQEYTDSSFIEKLANIFTVCRDLLAEDGSLWIVIGDTRHRYGKLLIPTD